MILQMKFGPDRPTGLFRFESVDARLLEFQTICSLETFGSGYLKIKNLWLRLSKNQKGDVAIFVKSGIDHNIFTQAKSELETVGMRIVGHRIDLDVINIFSPTHTSITETELFDSLCPINNLLVKQGRVFLGCPLGPESSTLPLRSLKQN